ncbi:murein hydrolase activator EnvC family protein [Hespellia stercorisuis]|uniref:Septal ring factor EnvC, activator of murein hydrolases AmiA and AmiB n=1 Tax=Hespellia stercorisuis DSM 15480 TaxID=1121950 RepID=A0A1M6T1G8_9FIRM|nr:peptidoglycan DD-metalloendopeptidase family protein [Hespellia stercorisuis]SHK50835.1 Septal ring factor EnvC, activator of murein hydrolases AmiA and AmiB [Hespellia stercorisuis DSM 15480]
MKKQKNRVISAVLCLALSASVVMNVGATTIDEAQQKANELESQKQSTQAEQNALADQLNLIAEKMTQTQAALDEKKTEITQAENDLIAAKVDENDQYTSMKKRIKYMYESGDTQFLEILVEAKDMNDFLNTAEYVSQISAYDRDMLKQFQDTVAEVQAQEDSLKAEYEELSNLQDELTGQQAQVQTLLDNNNVKLADLESQIGANAQVLADLKAAAEAAARAQAEAQAAAEAAAAQAAAEAASSGGGSSYIPPSSSIVVSGNGQFTNPCPGASYISSEFGEYRSPSDPAHKGRDYAASTGTPTYSAADGTVLIAGYSSSAGNWVVIDHGNGLVTKYMHHSSICVSAGQSVSRGQQIGAVGSTGDSTGPHLHFQAESGGVAVDPRNFM